MSAGVTVASMKVQLLTHGLTISPADKEKLTASCVTGESTRKHDPKRRQGEGR